MRSIIIILLSIFSLITFNLNAQAAPAKLSEIKAPNGGHIKAINNGFVEVVNNRSVIKIFIYDKNLKLEKQMKDFSLVAEIQRPYSKDLETLDLKDFNGGYTASFDAGDIRNLDIGIANRRSGSADRISFDFEPVQASLTN